MKKLLKAQSYVEFVHMTNVLPITKYSSGSELNMLVEHDMATSEKFSKYFGFSDEDVNRLYEIYQRKTAVPKFICQELRIWYNGFYSVAGIQLYNPRSVVFALTDNQLQNYWTSSGPYDKLFYYIRHNIKVISMDLALLRSRNGYPLILDSFLPFLLNCPQS